MPNITLFKSSRLAVASLLVGLSAYLHAQVVDLPKKDAPPKPLENTSPLTKDQKDSVLKGIDDLVTNRVFVPGIDFKQWPAFFEKHKDDVDKAENVTDFTRSVQKILGDFGITHFRLQTPRAASQRGKTTSVGAGMVVVEDEKGLKVRRISEEGPAKAAGIEVGDVIVKVNEKKPEKTTEVEGDEGTKLKVSVLKASGDTKDMELELKKFSTVRKETLTWSGEDAATLRVFTFSAGYGRANIEQLMTEAAKAKYLVLDLRSNGGGATNNLNHLLSLLLPGGSDYGTFISRREFNAYKDANPTGESSAEKIAAWSKNKTKTRERAVKPFTGKIAVLINRGSASASEICSAALREVGGAKIYGTKSAGAVLASVFGRLPEGFMLQYPVSDYVTVKGVRLEKNPLVPDEEVTGKITEDGKDPVVEAALAALRGAK